MTNFQIPLLPAFGRGRPTLDHFGSLCALLRRMAVPLLALIPAASLLQEI